MHDGDSYFDQFDGLPCRSKKVQIIAGELGHLRYRYFYHIKVKLNMRDQYFDHLTLQK